MEHSHTFKVSELSSPEAAKKIRETILTGEPEASVETDTDSQTITVKTSASEESVRQLITSTGYKVAS